MKLETRIRQSITHRKGVVISRSDLASLGSQSQVSFVLSRLVENGELLRISRGVYVKARLMGGEVKTTAPTDDVIRETVKKLGLELYGESKKELKKNQQKNTFVVEIKASRTNRTLSFNGLKIILQSYKKNRGNKVNSFDLVEQIPTKNIQNYVLALAKLHNISYLYSSIDQFADSVTSLAGDDVKHDHVEDLLIALKRAGKLSMQQVAKLSINYLRERHGCF